MRFPGRQLAAALAALCAAVWASQAEVIDDILGSLSRAATFLERHHEQINLDGLVGFIILQGWYRKHWPLGCVAQSARLLQRRWLLRRCYCD